MREYGKSGVVTIDDSRYPHLLKEIDDPPRELFFRGSWDAGLFVKCLAVVGSRRMSAYGEEVCRQVVSRIADAGVTIASGFMYGIDAAAHASSLEAGGRTVAVMPCGIDLIHPAYQDKLYRDIIGKKGLIVSEYPDDYPPQRWTYVRRNRIVAGISRAVVVVEAARKSGALITAALAEKYGRHLFAVPGPLTSPVSQGVFELIRRGAHIMISADDALRVFGLDGPRAACIKTSSYDFNRLKSGEKAIVNALSRGPLNIDILSRLAGIDISELGSMVSLLRLRGVLGEREGVYYVN